MLVGGTPMERTGGKPMRASSAATTRSQCSARSVPPARQLPCTWAMTGMAQSQTRPHPSARASMADTSPSIDRVRGEVARVGVLGDEAVARREGSSRAADDDHAGSRIGLGLADGLRGSPGCSGASADCGDPAGSASGAARARSPRPSRW